MVTSRVESDEARRFLRSVPIGISLFLMFKTEQCLGDGFASGVLMGFFVGNQWDPFAMM